MFALSVKMLQPSVVTSIRESAGRRLDGINREISSEMTDEEVDSIRQHLDRISSHLDLLQQ